ncbi:BLM RecQ DNA helicase family member, partial [Guillardia theta CCMP2712]
QKFDWTEKLRKINKHVFRNPSFRKHQEEIINTILSGHDCFVLMPTGGGKSLCYQLPALMSPGVTIVISPLVSLMHDQVYNLNLLRIGAYCISANTPMSELEEMYSCLRGVKEGINCQLIYITPEKFAHSQRLQNEMQRSFQNGKLSRIIIDEAHCVSEWGHDFRPDYKMLGALKSKLPGVQIMALTATATPRVRRDIRNILQINEAYTFMQSFNRPNLRYEVRKKEKKKSAENIATFIKENYPGETGIIYCLSKNRCEEMAAKMQEFKIKALPYHAGLDDQTRKFNQDQWSNDKTHVIVATIAFGMGINKPDVRFVIHESLPKSMEGYYQESGRAGRDGKISHCILYYSYSDKLVHDKMAQDDFDKKENVRNNLNKMVEYCETQFTCRRQLQLHYFGENFGPDKCGKTCDNC